MKTRFSPLIAAMFAVGSGMMPMCCGKKDEQTRSDQERVAKPKTITRPRPRVAPSRTRPAAISIRARLKRFAPTKIDFNDGLLDATDRREHCRCGYRCRQGGRL